MIVNANETTIAQAANDLNQGRLVAFPTETVYGLGGDARNGLAVAAIFEMKGRPKFNPLIVHVTGREMAARYGELNARTMRLIETFWPGPLTLVVPLRSDCGVSPLVTAGLETIALRSPSDSIARALLAAAQCPLATPSANTSGYVSPTRAEHVLHDLGDGPALILDGGTAPQGIESSVIDVTCDPPALLRPGAVAAEAIEEALCAELAPAPPKDAPRSPGQLQSHYAPRAGLRLNASSLEPGEALLAFGPDALEGAQASINLSPTGDLKEAAANLFAALRELDRSGVEFIAAMPIPREGLGAAINDRLDKAAHSPAA